MASVFPVNGNPVQRGVAYSASLVSGAVANDYAIHRNTPLVTGGYFPRDEKRKPKVFQMGAQPQRTFFPRIHNKLMVKPLFNDLGTIGDDSGYTFVIWNSDYIGDFLNAINYYPIAGNGVTVSVTEWDNTNAENQIIAKGSVVYGFVSVSFLTGPSGNQPVASLAFRRPEGTAFNIQLTMNVVRGGVVWTIPPNTGEAYGEKFKWSTDITMFEGGREQRASLKDFPSLAIEATYSVKDADLHLLNSLMWGWQGKEYFYPLWHKRQRLRRKATSGDTTLFLENTLGFSRIVEGGYVLAWLSPYLWQVLQVESITLLEIDSDDSYRITVTPLGMDLPRGAHIFPLRRGARMEKDVKGQSPVANLTALPIRFTMKDDEEYAAEDSGLFFEDTYVVDMQPNWVEPMDESTSRDVQEFQNNVSMDYFFDRSEAPRVVRGFYFWMNDPEKIDKFMKWLYARRGSAVSFWLPSGKSDMELFSDVYDPLQRSIDIRFINAATMYSGSLSGREAVLITLKNGTKIAKRIKSIENGAGYGQPETVTFTTAIGQTFTVSQVREINFMGKNRLSSDEVVIEWHSDRLIISNNNMTTLIGE